MQPTSWGTIDLLSLLSKAEGHAHGNHGQVYTCMTIHNLGVGLIKMGLGHFLFDPTMDYGDC